LDIGLKFFETDSNFTPQLHTYTDQQATRSRSIAR